MQREKNIHQHDHMPAVGIDVVSVSDVADALSRFGDEYIDRIFTPQEDRDCRSAASSTVSAWFAARFAAKEATVKMLRPDGPWTDWRAIEVRRHRSGWCHIALHGEARRLASRRGIRTLTLSMTHNNGHAAAIVIGRGKDPVRAVKE